MQQWNTKLMHLLQAQTEIFDSGHRKLLKMAEPEFDLKNKKLLVMLSVIAAQILFVIWYFDEVGTINSKLKTKLFFKPTRDDNETTGLSPKESLEQDRFLEFRIDKEEKITLKLYPPMKEYNNLRITHPQTCRANNPVVNSPGKFVVVTNFIYFKLEHYRKNLEGGSLAIDNVTLEARVMEVINVLQSNLNLPEIEEVHVLVKEEEAIEYLRHLPLKNSEKLVVYVPSGTVNMKTQLEYAGECLVNKVIAIAHQDNRFGKGWEKLNPEILKNKNVAYAITRHTPEFFTCKGAKFSANCDPGSSYIGSHDVFVFFVKQRFDASLLKDIDNVTPNLSGMENLLIWLFDKKFNFKVLNPCLVFFVHHHHCISIRDKGRRRVNGGGRSGTVGFTDKLEP